MKMTKVMINIALLIRISGIFFILLALFKITLIFGLQGDRVVRFHFTLKDKSVIASYIHSLFTRVHLLVPCCKAVPVQPGTNSVCTSTLLP